MFCSLMFAVVLGAAEAKPAVHFAPPAGKTPAGFEVVDLAKADIERLKKAELSNEKWQELFAVYVMGEDGKVSKDQPAIVGSYQLTDGGIRFTPRFPLLAGVVYQAVYRPAKLPGATGGDEIRVQAGIARAKPAAAAEVKQVYPTRDTLPENQLKFYLHFTAPMSQGEAYRHITLLDAKGKAIEAPFLELDQELWDPTGHRFTLYFDPGRIKRGVKPREDVGPSLIEGKTYTLVIDQKWKDAEGNPLKEAFRKTFKVSAPVETPIDLKDWTLDAPAAQGVNPLTVKFPRSLDHALLHGLLTVTDEKGTRVAGSVRVTDEETVWQFTPAKPWKAGNYRLVVDKTLEDLAGNSVGKPFEVDVFRKIDPEVKPETEQRTFEVKAGK